MHWLAKHWVMLAQHNSLDTSNYAKENDFFIFFYGWFYHEKYEEKKIKYN